MPHTPSIQSSLRLLSLLAVVLLTRSAGADDWMQFRGPGGLGVTKDAAPTEWSAEKNVKWRLELDEPGNGSPIVVADKVFICSANAAGTERRLLCIDRQSGTRLWEKTVRYEEEEPTHKTNPHGATTPVSDGQRVVVSHGSAGLYCYDLDGKQLWVAKPGVIRHMWGYGASPVIHKDRVFVNWGPHESIFLGAYSLDDGKELFRTEEPVDGNGERNSEGKYMGSWATPIAAEVNGREMIICSFPTRVVGFDPKSGQRIWYCEGLRGPRGDLAYTSPHLEDARCVAIGGYQGPSIGFDIEGLGDITEKRLWRNEKNPQAIGSGVLHDGQLYVAFAGPNLIKCIDSQSGEERWQTRSNAGAHWASTVMAGGLLYATGQKGETIIFKPNPNRFELVGRNRLDETCNATPAIVDGQIFIRTYKALYCIE